MNWQGLLIQVIVALVGAGAGWLVRHFTPPKKVVPANAAQIAAQPVTPAQAADLIEKDGL